MAVDFDKMVSLAQRSAALSREDALRKLVYGKPPIHEDEIKTLDAEWLPMYAEYCNVNPN